MANNKITIDEFRYLELVEREKEADVLALSLIKAAIEEFARSHTVRFNEHKVENKDVLVDFINSKIVEWGSPSLGALPYPAKRFPLRVTTVGLSHHLKYYNHNGDEININDMLEPLFIKP